MLKKNDSNYYSMNDISLAELADKYQTPLYVYSADQIRKNIQQKSGASENGELIGDLQRTCNN